MGIEEVKKHIVDEARKQADKLAQDADAETRRMSVDAEHEVKNYEKEIRANAEKMLAALERKELAAAEFEGKRLVLDRKKEIIAKAVEEAKKELKELAAQDRKEALLALLERAKKELDIKRVYVNKHDAQLIKEKGIAVKEKDIIGGLIAENEEGTISVDMSFNTLVEEIVAQHLQELSGVLFK